MKTKQILEIIDENFDKVPEILNHISTRLTDIQEICMKDNNDLRNALGNACSILALDRKPNDKQMKKYCGLIEKTHFPNGIESWHHQGEKNFYNRYLK